MRMRSRRRSRKGRRRGRRRRRRIIFGSFGFQKKYQNHVVVS
jgi:hypothetical protein